MACRPQGEEGQLQIVTKFDGIAEPVRGRGKVFHEPGTALEPVVEAVKRRDSLGETLALAGSTDNGACL